MDRLSRRHFNGLLTAGAIGAVCAGSSGALGQEGSARTNAKLPPERYNSFKPGEVWRDTSGSPIQAHGGSMIRVGDKFYWYGENKEKTDFAKGIWHWGVRCYESEDLYNWTDLGLIIPPAPDDPSSPMHPSKGMDRPHILFNPATRKFVCWMKIMDFRAQAQTRAVFIADSITGPWSQVAAGIKPLGMNAGDFDMAASADDGKAYMYFERVHSELICADLNPDYTDFTGYYSTHMPRPGPPTVREAPAYFMRKGRHYLATSGTTGYFPNPTEIASAETFHGPWTTLGLLHSGDTTSTSFDSQISCIFRHPRKQDLYIAMADRWTAALSRPVWENARKAYAKQAVGKDAKLTPEERAGWVASSIARLDTSQARYVWLPITFEGDRPCLEWREEWRIEDFS